MAVPSIARIWTFDQLTGAQPKSLRLEGWSAPFGRPRQSAIINAGVTIRQNTIYYPGNVEPTVHSFGPQGKPFELKGRFMDRALARKNGAQLFAQTWKQFVLDERPVRAKWGDILSYRIFIEDIDLQIEGPADVAWELKAIVLADESQPVAPSFVPTIAPFDLVKQMSRELAKSSPFRDDWTLKDRLTKLLGDVSTAIDNAVAAVNAPFATIYDIASAISDFESALPTDLVKLTSGVQMMRTSLDLLRTTTDLAVQRTITLGQTLTDQGASSQDMASIISGGDMVTLLANKADSDRAASNLAALIAEMQRQLDLKTRGTAQTAYVAKTGDTWDTIAQATGASSSAIRASNNIRFGAKPVAGRKYSIPSP